MRLKLYRGWWYVAWREDGETRRRALRTKDRDAAARAPANYQRHVSAPADTAASIYAAYLADKGTERARWAWGRLERTFGALRPDQIDRAACRAYVTARRADDVGDGTIHTELTFLRAALRRHDRTTPAVVELPSKPPPSDRHLTRQQYERLLAASSTPHIKLFAILAVATAGRMAPILELTWDRVDFGARGDPARAGGEASQGPRDRPDDGPCPPHSDQLPRRDMPTAIGRRLRRMPSPTVIHQASR